MRACAAGRKTHDLGAPRFYRAVVEIRRAMVERHVKCHGTGPGMRAPRMREDEKAERCRHVGPESGLAQGSASRVPARPPILPGDDDEMDVCAPPMWLPDHDQRRRPVFAERLHPVAAAPGGGVRHRLRHRPSSPWTLFLVGIGVGQLIYGPLSDRYGRRPVLLVGLGPGLSRAALCAYSPRRSKCFCSGASRKRWAVAPAWCWRARWCAIFTAATNRPARSAT